MKKYADFLNNVVISPNNAGGIQREWDAEKKPLKLKLKGEWRKNERVVELSSRKTVVNDMPTTYLPKHLFSTLYFGNVSTLILGYHTSGDLQYVRRLSVEVCVYCTEPV